MLLGKTDVPGDAPAAIAAAYEEARAVAVNPPAADTKLVWGYTDFGPPGSVMKREHVTDLDLDEVTFSNGARLNLKRTNFEAGRIRVSARVGNGNITEPRDKPGLTMLANMTFTEGGLGKHSADDVRRMFAGRNVGWNLVPDGDAFRLFGTTTTDDLLLDLQLLAAHLSDPGYRPESLRIAREAIDHLCSMLDHSVYGPLSRELALLVAGGDSRFGTPSRADLAARTLDELKDWLHPQVTRGALEVALVGDFDVETAINAAARTIAALPAREPKPDLSELKKVAFPAEPFVKSYTIDSEIPKGAVAVYWPASDRLEARRNRRMNLLADILKDRLRAKIREAIGGTYTPSAANHATEFPGFGYLHAMVDVDPASAAKIQNLIIDIADDLRLHGATEDEFKRAHEPMVNAAEQASRDNEYWLSSVLARAQQNPEWLDWARSRLADLRAIRREDESALAAQYLGRERASRAIIAPVAKP